MLLRKVSMIRARAAQDDNKQTSCFAGLSPIFARPCFLSSSAWQRSTMQPRFAEVCPRPPGRFSDHEPDLHYPPSSVLDSSPPVATEAVPQPPRVSFSETG